MPTGAAQRIRRLRIVSTRQASGLFAGAYRSGFKGAGLEFQEVKPYLPGDEVRCIDWKVTARTGRPFVKRFREERELTVMLLLDISPSALLAGSAEATLAAETCGLLAAAAAQNQDRVGLLAFTDRVERYLPPARGIGQVQKILRDALTLEPSGTGTDLAQPLGYLERVLKRPAVLFLISDFLAPPFQEPLARAARRHDVVAVTLVDPLRLELPEVGLVTLRDPETGVCRLIDSSNRRLREEYRARELKRRDELRQLLHACQVDQVLVSREHPPLRALGAFFRMREKRRPR